MTKSDLLAKMQDAGAWLPGKTVKIDFGGDDGVILIDGANSLVSDNDGAADTTIKVSWDDFQSLASGTLDGMTAFMTGKLKVEGDMGNAMQLQGIFSKLRGSSRWMGNAISRGSSRRSIRSSIRKGIAFRARRALSSEKATSPSSARRRD